MSTTSAAITSTESASVAPISRGPRSLTTGPAARSGGVLDAAPLRASAQARPLARLWRAMHRPPRPPAPAGVPLIHNKPEQFGQSFRYPDGTWFHGC